MPPRCSASSSAVRSISAATARAGGLILVEPELHFGNDVLVPDLAGWRRERLPTLPADAYMTLAPDWICEVLSPSTETLDRDKKLHIYAREGVRPPGSSIRCGKRSKCWRWRREASSSDRREHRSKTSVRAAPVRCHRAGAARALDLKITGKPRGRTDVGRG